MKGGSRQQLAQRGGGRGSQLFPKKMMSLIDNQLNRKDVSVIRSTTTGTQQRRDLISQITVWILMKFIGLIFNKLRWEMLRALGRIIYWSCWPRTLINFCQLRQGWTKMVTCSFMFWMRMMPLRWPPCPNELRISTIQVWNTQFTRRESQHRLIHSTMHLVKSLRFSTYFKNINQCILSKYWRPATIK